MLATLATLIFGSVVHANLPDVVKQAPSLAERYRLLLKKCTGSSVPESLRKDFAELAKDWDSAWANERNPSWSLMRARSHLFAGNTDRAIASIHDGLQVIPHSTVLQQELLNHRLRVPDPFIRDPDFSCLPSAPHGLHAWVSPWWNYCIGCLFALGAAASISLALTSRPRASRSLSILFSLGLVCSIALACVLRDPPRHPIVIVSRDSTTLRTGNGNLYPLKVEVGLPRGVELREVTRRGGWIQVQLTRGGLGWISESDVVTCQQVWN